MDNDAARHELTDALALIQGHLADLAVVQTKRAAMTATATAAEGTVAVTVNANGVVANTTVDESYLDDFDLADLGNHVTAAAQAAAADAAKQSAALLAPIAERRAQFPSLSAIVDGAPDIRRLLPDRVDRTHRLDGDRNPENTTHYPTVRSWQ